MSRAARRHMRQLADGVISAYDTQVLASGPVAYWTLNGGSAGAADRTGNGHTAAYQGGSNVTTFLDGSLATLFDGATQYLEVADSDALSVPTTGILTIEAWMRPDTLEFPNDEDSGYVHWMGKGEANQHEYVARMYSYTNDESRPNRISGYSFNLTGGLGTGSYFQDAIIAGQWIHYVLVINTVDVDAQYTTGYTKIYKNGEQRDKDALTSYDTIPGNGTAPFRIGTRNLQSFFQGAVGKVAIYDYELSATTIRDRFQAIVPPNLGSTAFIKNVGSVSTKVAGTTLNITVPQGGVSAGNTILVKVAHEYTVGGPTVIDSRGNTYTRDQTSPNAGTTMRASLFSAPINAALEAGDTISLITSASVGAKAMVADEFSGLVFVSNLDQKNSTSGTSTTPGTTIPITTTQDDELLAGFVAVNGPTDDGYNEDDVAQWVSHARAGTTGDADATNVVVNSAYKRVGEINTFRYQPTLGVSQSWIEIIASYKAGVPIITPPVQGTAIFIQSIGSAAAKTSGTVLTITVPFGGVPVGHTLIARVMTDYTSGAPTVTDSRGNTYTRDRTAANGTTTVRASIYSCQVTTELLAGDVITITASASIVARAAAVDEFANVLLPITVDAQNGLAGTSATPSLPITTVWANDLLIGFVGVEGPVDEIFNNDVIHQWTGLNRAGTSGDAADTNITVNGAYRVVGTTDTYTYAPTLGASANWVEFAMAYRAA